MSVPERVGNYSRISRWLLGVIERGYALQFRRRPPCFNGVAQSLTLPRNGPGPETRAVQPVLKRSDRTSPGERAGERLLQPLFCGAQERWRSPPDSRSQAHQQSALQASVQNDIAGTGPCANSPLGTGASVDLKDAYFHIQIAPHHRRFLRFALEGTALPVPCSSVWAGFGPRTFSKCMDAALPPPLRASGTRVLNYLDDWLILAQSWTAI